ncbi:MAG: type II toxin-antitoxin system HicB family antitoxin [Hyphomicrobium sp.]
MTPDDNGALLVTCSALPELVTFGEDVADARRKAVDAIEEALAARLADGRDLPVPTEARSSSRHVALPTLTALKVLLWHALKKSGITRAELARRLGCHREQVDRLFRVDHASRLDMIDDAFRALGAEVTVAARFRGDTALAGQ